MGEEDERSTGEPFFCCFKGGVVVTVGTKGDVFACESVVKCGESVFVLWENGK